jgi:hypothetical protein
MCSLMRRYVDTRERVAELFEHGLNGRQIASRLGLSRSAAGRRRIAPAGDAD